MQTQTQKQSRSNASRTGNALSVSSTSGTRVSAKASTRTKYFQSSLENNTRGNSLAEQQELSLTEASRADTPIADVYSSKAKAVIAIWLEIAVSSRLGFLPVDLYTQATANAIAKYEDDLPAVCSLIEHAVHRERAKPTRWSKNLCRVLHDALSGSHWFESYDYTVNRKQPIDGR